MKYIKILSNQLFQFNIRNIIFINSHDSLSMNINILLLCSILYLDLIFLI